MAPSANPTPEPPPPPPPPSEVLQDLRLNLTGNSLQSTSTIPLNEHRTAVALPVAAIKSLLGVIKRSRANTMMGLQEELRKASQEMLEYAKTTTALLGGRSHIALASGCELFLKYITRCFLELPDFTSCIGQILERGERFAEISLAARDRIADCGHSFILEGQTVLTHGWSRVVTTLLLRAAQRKQFSVIVLEGRPDAAGAKAAKFLTQAGVPCTVVLDAAMAYVMERVDSVIVGAEGVLENGGIVNKIGTYALGIAARDHGKPFYVAAESYKFARLYPLNQRDLPELGVGTKLSFVDTASWEATGGLVGKESLEEEEEKGGVKGLLNLEEMGVMVENPPCDYTPAKYITLLFTDLGTLTTSAVSDELIRLYQ